MEQPFPTDFEEYTLPSHFSVRILLESIYPLLTPTLQIPFYLFDALLLSAEHHKGELAFAIVKQAYEERPDEALSLANVNKAFREYVQELMLTNPPHGALPYFLSRVEGYEFSKSSVRLSTALPILVLTYGCAARMASSPEP